MTEGDAMMQEHKCTCYCGGSMFYRHLHADHCPLAVHGEEAPKSKEYEAAYAAGRVAGLREGMVIAQHEMLCAEDEAYDNGLPNQTQGTSYNQACQRIIHQIEQAAQEVKSE